MGHERRAQKAVAVGTPLEDIVSYSVWKCDFCGKEFNEPITIITGNIMVVLPGDHCSIPMSAYVGPECLASIMPFLDDNTAGFFAKLLDRHGIASGIAIQED